MKPIPDLFVENRQRRWRLNVPWLRIFAREALRFCAENSADQKFALRHLEAVEVAIVSDRRIAEVHQRFMQIPGPTDVITFEHGEIVLSADTAEREARSRNHSVEVELALYTVHGLLHLNGHGDRVRAEAARMKIVQERIWQKCLATFLPRSPES